MTWIWAPAVFFCSLKSYLEGIPGIFWFVVPNVLCFVPFAIVAVRMRELMPSCHSMPEFVNHRFGGRTLPHLATVTTVLIIDIVAVIFNTLVGAFLLSTSSNVPFAWGVAFMVGIPLAYTVWRGLLASVETDKYQMYFILLFCLIFVPWAIIAAGGLSEVSRGIGGVTGRHRTIVETEIAFAWGIPASLALLAVPFSDQMFYQRAFAARRSRIFATCLFGVVPITLSLLGFLGANPEINAALTAGGREVNPLMINVEVLGVLLPHWAIVAFGIMAMCALSSTLDSAYCAISSIVSVDVYRRYVNPSGSEERAVYVGEIAMVTIAVLAALLVVLVPLKGEWLFNINGSVACCVVPPLLLSVYWRRVAPLAAFLAIAVPLIFLGPYAVVANVEGDPVHIVVSMVGILVVSTVITVFGSLLGSRKSVDDGQLNAGGEPNSALKAQP